MLDVFYFFEKYVMVSATFSFYLLVIDLYSNELNTAVAFTGYVEHHSGYSSSKVSTTSYTVYVNCRHFTYELICFLLQCLMHFFLQKACGEVKCSVFLFLSHLNLYLYRNKLNVAIAFTEYNYSKHGSSKKFYHVTYCVHELPTLHIIINLLFALMSYVFYICM